MSKHKTVITIGTFDGVHRGHKLLLEKTVEAAKKRKMKSLVITLEKPVRNVDGLLSCYKEKTELMKNYGIDGIAVIAVPSDVLNLSPDGFYEKILNAITEKDLSRSGFSEFETYGNYLYTRHPELFQYRPLKTQRHGMFYYGKIPDVDELKNSLYDTVSFEEYDTRKERILRGIKQICGYVKKFV